MLYCLLTLAYNIAIVVLHSLLEAISDNTVMQGLLVINSLGEQQHFVSAVVKILAMHPDVRVSVQSVGFRLHNHTDLLRQPR